MTASSWTHKEAASNLGRFTLPGRGGDSYQAYVVWEDHEYDMNAMLRLLDMNNRAIIDEVDTVAASNHIGMRDHVAWLRIALETYPDHVNAVLRHMKAIDEQ